MNDAVAAETIQRTVAARATASLLVLAFTATTFLSAMLLFSIQPMFAKMVLPVLGGAPSVWAVAVCFFQIALLAGYCYAHWLKTRVSFEMAGWVHLSFCTLALAALPIALPAHWGEPPAGEPYLWQLGLFTAAVGLPFIAVAANAPLLQAWFTATRHPAAKDPYFLYAASNLGSFAALLGYPFVLEPALGLAALSRYWTFGFVALCVCLALVFWLTLKNEAARLDRVAMADVAASRPLAAARARWVVLSLIPSALLTAFTTHVATDVASAPLLWVLPLALYLLTFVIVFRTRALIPPHVLLPLHLIAVTAALLVLAQTWETNVYLTGPFGAAAFFISALVAHRTLYDERPDAEHLTEFYLWMAFGGALGGLFAALIAPRIFSEVFEYPLLLALTFACRPGALSVGRKPWDQLLALFVIGVAAWLCVVWIPIVLDRLPATNPWAWLAGWGASALAATALAFVLVLSWRQPVWQLGAALGMCAAVTLLPSMVKKGAAQRSYFGVYRVLLSPDGEFNTLVHGSTLHGAQRIRDEDGNAVADIKPATYYYEGSPMARTIATRRAALAAQGRQGRFGVVGLGTGSLACHAAEGERWRFFEIDPVVISIAGSGQNFTFLENCLPETDIRIGDARLTMEKEADASFDLLIIDAFSSDAVPVHLMTAEALKLYLAKLVPDGVLLLHISNRYLDLDAVLGATMPLVPEMHGFLLSDDPPDVGYAEAASTVAVFAKSEAALEAYKTLAEMTPFNGSLMRAWTDDYSDILRPFLSKYRRRFGG